MLGWVLIFLGLLQFKQAKTEIISASKVAYRFLLGATNNVISSPESTSNSNRGTSRFQGAWFKNLITTGAKPSSSSEVGNQVEESAQQQQQQQCKANEEALILLNKRAQHE